MGYLSNFIVYTLAMIGVIAVTLLIFKSTNATGNSKAKSLKVLDTLTIAPRKTLYVISCAGEKFLVAGDVGRTSFIAKLNESSAACVGINKMNNLSNIDIPATAMDSKLEECSNLTFRETMNNIPKSRYVDNSNLGIKSSILSNKNDTPYTSVIKSLAMKMK